MRVIFGSALIGLSQKTGRSDDGTAKSGGHGVRRGLCLAPAAFRRAQGYDYVHSAVDDHSRLAYSELTTRRQEYAAMDAGMPLSRIGSRWAASKSVASWVVPVSTRRSASLASSCRM